VYPAPGARRRKQHDAGQEITPATKLLAFGGQEGNGLIFIKAEFVTEFIANVTSLLTQFERTLQASSSEVPTENE
jgi:hypothetical protein